MLKKTKRKTTLTLTFLFIIILVSSFQVTSALKPENSSINQISTKQPVSDNSQSLRVAEHKITAEELNKLESQVGIYEKGKNYNQLVGDHGTGLQPPTVEEWQNMSESTYMIENVSYPKHAF